jgi:hypothetical protein
MGWAMLVCDVRGWDRLGGMGRDGMACSRVGLQMTTMNKLQQLEVSEMALLVVLDTDFLQKGLLDQHN